MHDDVWFGLQRLIRERGPASTEHDVAIELEDEIDHQPPALHPAMSSPFALLAFALVWFVVMRFVLPRFGVAT